MGEICRVYSCLLEEEKKSNGISYQRSMAFALLQQAFFEFFRKMINSEDIGLDANGKPFYKPDPACFFNISHCRDAVVVAVAKQPVGVDTEGFRRIKCKTVEKCCSREEMQLIFENRQTSPKADSCLLEKEVCIFLKFWTLKESYVKMTGKGLRIPLDQICFPLWDFTVQDENTLRRIAEDGTCSYLHQCGEVTIALTLGCCMENVPKQEVCFRQIPTTAIQV